jgi:hypothetical protein
MKFSITLTIFCKFRVMDFVKRPAFGSSVKCTSLNRWLDRPATGLKPGKMGSVRRQCLWENGFT